MQFGKSCLYDTCTLPDQTVYESNKVRISKISFVFYSRLGGLGDILSPYLVSAALSPIILIDVRRGTKDLSAAVKSWFIEPGHTFNIQHKTFKYNHGKTWLTDLYSTLYININITINKNILGDLQKRTPFLEVNW